MNFARHAAITLVLFAAACPVLAADYFWNCTKPDGTKYADATQCDKGDSPVKVFKAGSDPAAAATGAATTPALLPDPMPAMADSRDTAVCPANPAHCTRADYGATEATPRTQAITQFMRKKQCEFARRFPERCAKPD